MSDWIEWKWTPEKPYPETLETMCYVIFGDGWDSYENESIAKVGFWVYGVNNFREDLSPSERITHYRIAED
jgi:hypothetical protein